MFVIMPHPAYHQLLSHSYIYGCSCSIYQATNVAVTLLPPLKCTTSDEVAKRLSGPEFTTSILSPEKQHESDSESDAKMPAKEPTKNSVETDPETRPSTVFNPSPTDIALAMWPDGMVYGANVLYEIDGERNEKPKRGKGLTARDRIDIIRGSHPPLGPTSINCSHVDCYEQIENTLKKYGFHPTTSVGNKANLDAHKKVQGLGFGHGHNGVSFGETANNLIYCANCLQNELLHDGLNLCVIARVKWRGIYPKADPDDSNQPIANDGQALNSDRTVSVGVEVIEVYPHSSQCNIPIQERRNTIIDTEFWKTRVDIHVNHSPEGDISRRLWTDSTGTSRIICKRFTTGYEDRKLHKEGSGLQV